MAAVKFLFVLVHKIVCGLHSLADIVIPLYISRAYGKADIVGVVGKGAQLADLLSQLFLRNAGAEHHELVTAGTVDHMVAESDLQKRCGSVFY